MERIVLLPSPLPLEPLVVGGLRVKAPPLLFPLLSPVTTFYGPFVRERRVSDIFLPLIPGE